MNKIILLVGKSGSGKTTLAKILETKYGLKQVSSYTTREQRDPSEDGHIFVSEDEFDQITKSEQIVAYTEYNGYKYCATAKQISENDVYVIDPKGIELFMENASEDKKTLVIYIKSSDLVRTERMRKRGDTPEQILDRFITDEKEFYDFEEKADHVIENEEKSNLDVLARKIWLKFIE